MYIVQCTQTHSRNPPKFYLEIHDIISHFVLWCHNLRYQDGFLYESTNRPYDGAVMHSIATFGI